MSALIPAGDTLNSTANQDTGKSFGTPRQNILSTLDSHHHFSVEQLVIYTLDPNWTPLHKWRY